MAIIKCKMCGGDLKLMAKDNEKYLFPCFKGIQVQNLPEALSRLQALDLNNWGYEHDLLRGIEKVLINSKRRSMGFH